MYILKTSVPPVKICHFWKNKTFLSLQSLQYYEASHPHVLEQALGITDSYAKKYNNHKTSEEMI